MPVNSQSLSTVSVTEHSSVGGAPRRSMSTSALGPLEIAAAVAPVRFSAGLLGHTTRQLKAHGLPVQRWEGQVEPAADSTMLLLAVAASGAPITMAWGGGTGVMTSGAVELRDCR